MQRRSIVLALMMALFVLAEAYAQEPFVGTWKLNKKESIIPAGAPKNNTVTYEPAGGEMKVTVDGTDGEGKPVHSEWVGKFDGKDYSVSGDPNSDTREYTKVNDHLLRYTVKKGGEITMVGRVGVTSDGKTRTVSATDTYAVKQRLSTTSVFDKE